MRFRMRAALLAVLMAAAVARCGGGEPAFFSPQYEYEEDLTLSLDGSATMIVNASLPALAALRGLPVPTDGRARVDRDHIRALYSSPYADVVRISTWTRAKRRFVGVRLHIADIRSLPKAAPFSWSTYDLHREGDQTVYRQTLGAPARGASLIPGIGWTGDEVVAFRLHLPSRINYQNSRTLDTNEPRPAARGNILTWSQRLKDRLKGEPIAWQTGAPGVMAVRMDSQSILYRTLWLFALAFLAAVAVLVFLIWLTMRRGRGAVSQDPADRASSAVRR
jgi:hypothetical protein